MDARSIVRPAHGLREDLRLKFGHDMQFDVCDKAVKQTIETSLVVSPLTLWKHVHSNTFHRHLGCST